MVLHLPARQRCGLLAAAALLRLCLANDSCSSLTCLPKDEGVEAPSLLSTQQVRLKDAPQLQEVDGPGLVTVPGAGLIAAPGGGAVVLAQEPTELPGSNDASGPDALGEPLQPQLAPFAKWSLVAVVIGSASLPIVATLYFLFFPGPFDSSQEVMKEHGGAVPVAMQQAATKVYQFAWIAFRIAMFIVYFWFGILKCFGISPAEPLVQIVFRELPFIHISSADFFCKWMVGGGECLIALGYIAAMLPIKSVRFWGTICCVTVGVGHVTMVSLLPMVLLPNEVWQPGRFPYALTFEGQYIMKNLVLASGILLMANDLAKPEERRFIGGVRD